MALAADDLERAGLPRDPSRIDAEVLARHILNWDAATWIVRQREPASRAFRTPFDRAITRRRRREPVAYITGRREFFGRAFAVTRDVLVPRPETELVVQTALDLLSPREGPVRVADVGTGSGCLAVTIALERPHAFVRATDISPAAISVAAANASALGASGRIDFVRTALVGGTTEEFHLVVSNPPYVGARERATLEPDVLEYEPPLALFGGFDGLDVIRDLAPAAHRALLPGGWLVMEFGAGQLAGVCTILAASHLEIERVADDLASIPRAIVARKTRPSV